jgi:30S ribosomal protein S31
LTTGRAKRTFADNQTDHFMGKGDKKTKRGKIFMGSYGNTRPQKSEKNTTGSKPADSAKK